MVGDRNVAYDWLDRNRIGDPVGQVDLIRLCQAPLPSAQRERIRGEVAVLKKLVPLSRQLIVRLPVKGGDYDTIWADGVVEEYLKGKSALGWIKQLRKCLRVHRPMWLHCHGIRSAVVAAVARLSVRECQPKLIYEVHGAIAFESLVRNRGSIGRWVRFAALYMLENIAPVLADSMILVSDEIKKYYPLMCFTENVAIPRFVDNGGRRGAETNADGGLKQVRMFVEAISSEDRPVAVYCGSAASWQLPRATMLLLKALIEELGWRAVVMSTEPDVFRGMVKEIHSAGTDEDWLITGVEPEAVVPALELCDVGIILREDRVLNRVASPTKLYQYLYAGLAVIGTEVVYIQEDWLRSGGIFVKWEGKCLEGPEVCVTEEFCDALRCAVERSRLVDGYRKRWSWENGSSDLVSMYELDGTHH